MSALDDLGAWLAARDATQYAAGAASRQADVDAAQALVTAAQKALADYEASHPDVPVPKSELIEFNDFATQNSGMYLATASLVGKGSGLTTYRMKASSSTKGASVPTAKGSTNPLRLIRVIAGAEVGGFTLAGTEQGHPYGGLNIGPVGSVRLHDLIISGIPGYSSGPPGETFSIDLYHADNATLTDVLLDGRRDSGKGPAGAGVAATLLQVEYATGATTLTRVVMQYAASGFAVALWRNTGAQVFNDCVFANNSRHINIEQAIGGSYEFNRCTFNGLANMPWAAQIGTTFAPNSTTRTSAKVTFTDPVCDVWPLKVRTYGPQANETPQYPAGTNGQKDADIRCVIGGKDVTNDPTKFQFVHSG